MLNSARMCLPGRVLMTAVLLNTVHPSFSNTADTSRSIRVSCFKIPIFKLHYQNVRIITGNRLFIAKRSLIHVLRYTQKTASFEGVLYAFSQMSVLELEVISAQWPVRGWGSQGGAEHSLLLVGPCRVTRARSWLGRSQGNVAGCGGYPVPCDNRAKARNIPPAPTPPPPPSHLWGFLPGWENPVLVLLCFGSFLGLSHVGAVFHATPAPHHQGGTRSRITAYQGVVTDLGRGF